MEVTQNPKPGVAHVEVLTFPLPENKLPDLTAEPWWLDCTMADMQVLPPDPTDPESYAVVAYEERGDVPGNDSSRLSSTSDLRYTMNSKKEIQNLRAILQIGEGGKLRVRYYSTYF
ncbi:hypothetical protein [Larkinella arboricola]